MADPHLIAQGEDTADRAYDYIVSSIAERQIPPTVREVGTALGLTANGARAVLLRLEGAGRIRLIPKTSRGIVVL